MRSVTMTFLLFGVFLIILLVVGYACGLRVNLTPSMPQGVYRVSDAAPVRGDAVMCRLEGDFARFVAARGYMGIGRQADELPPLVKSLAAVPGDTLRVTPRRICIVFGNAEHCPLTGFFREYDSQGRPMPPSLLPFGDFVVPDGKALLLGDHEGSLDSRYFGLVDLARVRKVEPLFTFNRRQ